MIKVAAIQMCSSHVLDENLQSAEKLIQEAALQGAKLIVLPEMFAMMGMNEADKLSIKEPFGKGVIQSFLANQAIQHGLWIVGGTIPIESEHVNKIYASTLVFDDKGICVGRYDKIHLFDVTLSKTEAYLESNSVTPGNHLAVIDSPFGKLGLAVCYDLRFPELFRVMFNQGVEIFIVPTAFTQKTGEAHWESLVRSRAIENFSYVIASCQGGKHSNGRDTFGHSMIVAPWGNIIAENHSTTAGVIYAEIDQDKIASARATIPVADHQRIFFDVNGLIE